MQHHTYAQAVLITAQGRNTFTEEQLARLTAAGEIRFHKALDPIPEGELAELLRHADVAGLTPRSVPAIDESWVGGLNRLSGIAVFATGVDYIDTALLAERGIALRNLPDYSTESVAEHTLGLLLTMSRRIHLSQDRVRGRVPAGTSVKGWELRGKTLGLVGLGRIGSRVAELAAAFGMTVCGFDPDPAAGPAFVKRLPLAELLETSDVVSLHYPSGWQAGHSFGAEQLRAMKTGATLLNVSRSALVDNEAVIAAIEEGRLRGYAVDDYFALRERAARLIEEGRILQTGHTAWYSEEVIGRGYDTWVDHVVELLQAAAARHAAGKAETAKEDAGP